MEAFLLVVFLAVAIYLLIALGMRVQEWWRGNDQEKKKPARGADPLIQPSRKRKRDRFDEFEHKGKK